MKIILKKLNLINFKGIKNLSVNFDQDLTNIFGDNATGKTSIFDAFTWLFFGKESTDRKDFNIKNTVNLELNRQEHEVNAIIEVNGSDIEIRRIYKEKHVKKRGSSTTEFAGHETEYFWDGVPANQSEFNAKIGELINESIFKLVANPSYFNSLNWKDRRNILFDIAGSVTNEEVASGNPKYFAILDQLTNNKTLDDLKRQFGSKKKLIKEELDAIPTRIDEINRNMPEEPNSIEINKQIEILKNEINEVEIAMTDRSKANEKVFDKITKHQAKIHEAKEKVNNRIFEIKQEYNSSANSVVQNRNEILFKISPLESKLENITREQNQRNKDINDLKLSIAAKRKDWAVKKEQWETESKKTIVFNEHEFSCPTCRRAYESNDIEGMKSEMVTNFNNAKTKKLEEIASAMTSITEQGKIFAERMAKLETVNQDEEILKLKENIALLCDQLESFDEENAKPSMSIQEVIDSDKEYLLLSAEVQKLTDTLPVKPEINIDDLKVEKEELQAKIQELSKSLANEDTIKANKERIAHLENEEKRLASELAEYEGQEFLIDEFNKERIEAIESRINGKFSIVTFKMFNPQINGGEVETCEVMVNSVPYSDLNKASQINAGLDIINTLSDHYGVRVPCFIDNAESVTRLHQISSQIIRLIVSEADKTLRVA